MQPIQGTRKEVTVLRENANNRILDFINTTNRDELFQSLRFTDEATNLVQSRKPKKTTELQGIHLGAGENDDDHAVCTVDISLEVLRKIASKLGFRGCHDRSKEDICLKFVTLWNANNDNSNNNNDNDDNDNNNNNNNNDYLDDNNDGEEGKEGEEKEEETDTSAGAGTNFADTTTTTFDKDVGNNDNDGIVNSPPLRDHRAAREQQQDPP